MYVPRQPPSGDVTALQLWLGQELQNIRSAMEGADSITLQTLYAAPGRLYEGLTVLADGTAWNPGAGAGVYTYYAGSWKKLG